MKSNFQKYYLKKITQYTHDVKCELRHYLFKLNNNSFYHEEGLTDKDVIQELIKTINQVKALEKIVGSAFAYYEKTKLI